jgi:hypothetical protein
MRNKRRGSRGTRQVPIHKNNNRRGSGAENQFICRSSPISVQENLPKYYKTGKDQQQEVSSLVDG